MKQLNYKTGAYHLLQSVKIKLKLVSLANEYSGYKFY